MKWQLRFIRLVKVGPLDDVTIEFFDKEGKILPVCILAGANGCGKTTVLDGIIKLFSLTSSSDNKRLKKYPSLQDKEELAIEVFVDFDSVHFRNNGKAVSDKGAIFFDAAEKNLQYASTIVKRFMGEIANLEEYLKRDEELEDWLKTETVCPPCLLYFEHLREINYVERSQIEKEKFTYQSVRKLSANQEFRGSLESYLIWLEYAETEKWLQIQHYLNRIDFDGKTFSIKRKTLQVMVRTKEGEEHGLHELSSGEQNILFMLTELRRWLTPNSIVLIDEVENSLHPAFQYKLAKALLLLQEEIPFQLIVTTHSLAIVDAFGQDKVRILTPL